MKPHYLNRRARFVMSYYGVGVNKIELQYRLKWWRWYIWQTVATRLLIDSEYTFEKVKHECLSVRKNARRQKAQDRKFLKDFSGL